MLAGGGFQWIWRPLRAFPAAPMCGIILQLALVRTLPGAGCMDMPEFQFSINNNWRAVEAVSADAVVRPNGIDSTHVPLH